MTQPAAIFLAPHFEYPPHNGGDVYIERLACHLSRLRGEVRLLGVSEIFEYQDARLVRRTTYPNVLRSKNVAALRVIAHGSHYYLEKFLTPAFVAHARDLVETHPDSLLFCSYLVTASVAGEWASRSRPPVVLTQNDEIAWFGHQQRVFRNPLQKLVAWLSQRWVRAFLQMHPQDGIYAHITETDYAGYEGCVPGHRHIIVPAGVDIYPLIYPTISSEQIRLVFCGALGVQMNYDALLFFKEGFWPLLKERFQGRVEMSVAGSRPAAQVQNLCREQGWSLHADLPDEEFRAFLTKFNFSILPFPYTTGAKLKLLTSQAAGLPVMATANMNIMPGQAFPPNLYSDSPQDWLNHLERCAKQSLYPETRAACQQFASRYAWQNIVEKMDTDLKAFGL